MANGESIVLSRLFSRAFWHRMSASLGIDWAEISVRESPEAHRLLRVAIPPPSKKPLSCSHCRAMDAMSSISTLSNSPSVAIMIMSPLRI
eukprot:CAMPEP_0201993436 /NCGR_PEP_ID=MMETSP0905-20130828/1676_1 /ASSEMBLY_ACC=CAM_ASM_000554 /TAXON_ID=420261 /ORGANISM="Thalassiosira antarctica, Strain CCMP982" /LENGTH=89 /DNA_ID=CAMNT_0048548287 /DNA_START=23 /DNA_END=292 /DNA_ORIENTATION=-